MSQAISTGVHGHARAHQDAGHHTTGWVGWIAFGSFMMSMLGIFQMIAGIVAIFNHAWYVVSTNQLLLFHSVAAWGWVHLIIGAIIFIAGISLLSGAAWARVTTVLLAGLSIISYLLAIALYPIWSIIAITLAVLVIYAVLVHGDELYSEDRSRYDAL